MPQAWAWYLLVFGSWCQVCHLVCTEPGDCEARPAVTALTSSLRPRHGGTTKLDLTTGQEVVMVRSNSRGPRRERAVFEYGWWEKGVNRKGEWEEDALGILGRDLWGLGVLGARSRPLLSLALRTVSVALPPVVTGGKATMGFQSSLDQQTKRLEMLKSARGPGKEFRGRINPFLGHHSTRGVTLWGRSSPLWSVCRT